MLVMTSNPIVDVDNDWTQKHRLKSRIIARYDQFISVEVADLNGDNRPEILATIAAISGKPGKLVAYEMPVRGDFEKGRWRKHVLSEWQSSGGKFFLISPKSSSIFFPSQTRSKKPHILVSGGDDGNVYIVSPDSWSYVSWSYTTHEIFRGKYPIGDVGVRDIDGDGNSEIFIPSGQRIHVLRLGDNFILNFEF